MTSPRCCYSSMWGSYYCEDGCPGVAMKTVSIEISEWLARQILDSLQSQYLQLLDMEGKHGKNAKDAAVAFNSFEQSCRERGLFA